MTKRLDSLDGLRGLAIISVILTHTPNDIIYQSLPNLLHPLFKIASSGGIGVLILFVMTGFLMAWLYPQPQSTLRFYARRFLRLLPPFLTMAISHTIIKLFTDLTPGFEIPIILTVALITNIIWKKLSKASLPLGKILPITWLTLQITVALFYALIIMKIDPSIYFQIWSHTQQTLFAGLINTTLTFPFGQYVAQLDGVYWTLAVEMMFYTLFPIICIPMYKILKQSKPLYRYLFLSSLPPFFFGLQAILQRVLWLHMYSAHLAIFFVAGMLIGFNLNSITAFLNKIPKWIIHISWISTMFYAIFGMGWVSEPYVNWTQIVTVIPVSILTLTAIIGTKYWGKILNNRILTTIGKYSYSLYLTHAVAIHIITSYIQPTTFINGILIIILSIVGSLLLSKALFFFTEKPYFTLRSNQHKQINLHLTTSSPNIFSFKILILASAVFLLFSAYAFTVPSSISSFTIPITKAQPTTIITEEPTTIPFTPQANDLGMITSNINLKEIPNPSGAEPYAQLVIRLLKQDQIVAENSYKLSELSNSRFHPFGFPIQVDSKDQPYAIQYQIVPFDPARQVTLITSENTFNSIFYPSKKQLLSQPKLLTTWMIYNITEPLKNPHFWTTFMYISPTLGLFFYLIIHHQIIIPKRHFRPQVVIHR